MQVDASGLELELPAKAVRGVVDGQRTDPPQPADRGLDQCVEGVKISAGLHGR